MNAKCVVISEVDLDRLSVLIHSPRGRVSCGPLVTSLEQELSRGTVVAPSRVPRGVVTMNSRVRIRDVKHDQRETFTLVYPQDANIEQGRLSVLAPLGTALLGAKAGDVVEVNAPGGVRRIRVERILYQPEAAGDFNL
jgi:regulator of nucleoside diphosphate kinase